MSLTVPLWSIEIVVRRLNPLFIPPSDLKQCEKQYTTLLAEKAQSLDCTESRRFKQRQETECARRN